jgi:deazaflavin-dependent oxidoreductase (nitroreductase family)
MSTSMADFNQQVIDEFRANQGQVGGMFAAMPLVLLHHVGVKSGAERVVPLAYLEDDGRYVIFGSKAGAPTHPAWYHNIVASPATTIEVGDQSLSVMASEAEGAERDRLYSAMAERSAQFGEYAEKTDRMIPVIVLTPTG